MPEMQTIVTYDRGVCLSRGSTRFHCVGFTGCSLCQITLKSGFYPYESESVTRHAEHVPKII